MGPRRFRWNCTPWPRSSRHPPLDWAATERAAVTRALLTVLLVVLAVRAAAASALATRSRDPGETSASGELGPARKCAAHIADDVAREPGADACLFRRLVEVFQNWTPTFARHEHPKSGDTV